MKIKKLLSVILACATFTTVALTGCVKGGSGISNENTPLVISSDALDGVFNPFFYTSGPDGDVVGQTQIGMLNTDKDGNIVCGDNLPTVAKAFTYETVGTQADYDSTGSYENYYTDYWFAIKKGIKFSDGVELTINDVLFNMYLLLDPGYTGSSTLYSVDIQGLSAYRTQTDDESQQEGFNRYYEQVAADRIDLITQWADDENTTLADLETLDALYKEIGDGIGTFSLLEYIARAKVLFREELNSDWNVAATSLDDESYKKYGLNQTWQIFLAMEGLITFSNEDSVKNTPAAVQWNGYDKLTDAQKTQEYLVAHMYEVYIGGEMGIETYKANLKAITSGGWATAGNLLMYVKSRAIQDAIGDELQFPNVSGITVEKSNVIGRENKKELGGTYDILKVRINGVDPKAIYNLSFTVAPMHYYSTEASKFSITNNNFGVKYADSDFFDHIRSIQVPLGAGPYKATNSETNSKGVPSKSDFFRDNIVYFERNTYFETVGDTINNAKIRKLRYKVIANTQLFDAITGNSLEVLYGTPTAKQEYTSKLATMSESYGYALAENLGYGYIGINASKVEEVEIRQAIMHAMNTSLCLDYYGDPNLAQLIYRPMSTVNWAYPNGCESYYKYDQSGATSLALAQKAGYSLNKSGKLVKGNKTLKFTFTIAGESSDHPAYQVMQNAADILNKKGFEITVTTDSNALRKLSNGNLEVWAAAWSSTIDPDLYQVYHKDSSASATKNWGYKAIYDGDKSDIYYREIEIVDALSEKIEDARKTTVQSTRAAIYSECLDLVMDLAVELPVYQRMNLFVWNNKYIDSSSLLPATAYQSPLSEIWNVSLNEKK